MVVKTSWIKEILKHQCSVHDVVLGRHLLTPHFMVGLDPPNKLESTTSKSVTPSNGAGTTTHTQYNSVWDQLEADVSTKLLDSKCVHSPHSPLPIWFT